MSGPPFIRAYLTSYSDWLAARADEVERRGRMNGLSAPQARLVVIELRREVKACRAALKALG
jgi:hypothetical protein